MVVLITGASGGFGRVLGTTLVKKGMTVYGTMRRPEGDSKSLGINQRVHDIEHRSERTSQGHYGLSDYGWFSYEGSGEDSLSGSWSDVLLFLLSSLGGGDGDYGE